MRTQYGVELQMRAPKEVALEVSLRTLFIGIWTKLQELIRHLTT